MPNEVEVRIHGTDSLPTLVYLPGMHGDWTLVGSFRAAVADRLRFVEVVYPQTPDASLDDCTRAIQAALRTHGIARGWLLGESFGSQIAWQMIAHSARGRESGTSAETEQGPANFTAEGLILAGGFVRHPVNWAVRVAHRVSRALPLSVVKSCCCVYARYAKFRHRHAPETLADIGEFVARRTVAADRAAITHRYRLIAENDLRPVARQTRLPVFYLAGLVDPLVPWPFVRLWLRRRCPGYRGGVTFWSADHNVLATAPRPAAEQVFRWMSGVQKSGPVAATAIISETATAKASTPR
jgi:pimeloyl-ACP methyl ester carboxylesterase